METIPTVFETAVAKVEHQLDAMAEAAKRSLYPQTRVIMGHHIVCDYQNGKRIVFEFDSIVIARKHLAGLIVANAR